MLRFALTALTSSLVSILPCVAQADGAEPRASEPQGLRLFEPGDLPGRGAAARELLHVLRSQVDLPVAVAWTALANTRLAAGSHARSSLDRALQRANQHPDAEAALATLRIEVADVAELLTFRPRMEAELPVGFPAPQSVGELELREYPHYRMVRTAMRGGSMGAFWPLFRHIEKNGIAMTTPVQMDWSNDGSRSRPVQMAFLYGDPGIEPAEVQKGVEVVAMPAMLVLSIGAIGDDRADVIEELQTRIAAFVAANASTYAIDGAPRTMGYNSPMVPRDQRYFELQVPLRRLAPTTAATPSGPGAR